jgi:hypothetical protein
VKNKIRFAFFVHSFASIAEADFHQQQGLDSIEPFTHLLRFEALFLMAGKAEFAIPRTGTADLSEDAAVHGITLLAMNVMTGGAFHFTADQHEFVDCLSAGTEDSRSGGILEEPVSRNKCGVVGESDRMAGGKVAITSDQTARLLCDLYFGAFHNDTINAVDSHRTVVAAQAGAGYATGVADCCLQGRAAVGRELGRCAGVVPQRGEPVFIITVNGVANTAGVVPTHPRIGSTCYPKVSVGGEVVCGSRDSRDSGGRCRRANRPSDKGGRRQQTYTEQFHRFHTESTFFLVLVRVEPAPAFKPLRVRTASNCTRGGLI